MTIRKWKPFEDLLDMRDRINRLFESEFFKGSKKGDDSLSSGYPVADIYETKEAYVFQIEVPGLSKEDIHIEFVSDYLTIKGERKEKKEVERENYHRIESYSGNFSRSFYVPQDVDPNKIVATMKDGILELHLPKTEVTESKAIPISIK